MLKLKCSQHAIALHPISRSYTCKSAERAIIGQTLHDSSVLSHRYRLLHQQQNQPRAHLQKAVAESFQKDNMATLTGANYPVRRIPSAEPAHLNVFSNNSVRLSKLASVPNLKLRKQSSRLNSRENDFYNILGFQSIAMEVDEEIDHKFHILLRRFTSDEQLYVRALETTNKCFYQPLEQRYAQKRRKNSRKWHQMLNFQSQNIASILPPTSTKSLQGSLSLLADNAKSTMGKASRKIALRPKDTNSVNPAPTPLDPTDVLERMFFYLPTLIDLHTEFLAQLKTLLSRKSSILQLLYLLDSMVSRFKVYADIINHSYVKALADFESLLQMDKSFRKAVEVD
ncbi:hypothetical protein BDF19DRAFT_135096 [Syncephalis fuscata]|nr:hypothetical protein BDF19DRAFT_135096 [Syncephalis fuscata]